MKVPLEKCDTLTYVKGGGGARYEVIIELSVLLDAMTSKGQVSP